LHVITAGEEFHLALRTYAAFDTTDSRAGNLAQCRSDTKTNLGGFACHRRRSMNVFVVLFIYRIQITGYG
jgi:hypothetical protein